MQQHETGLDMSGLVLMGMPNCGGCMQASQWLENNNVVFRKYDVSTSPRIVQWLMQTTGQRTVPQFFFNGQHIQGGFAQVQGLASGGHLPRHGGG